MANCDYCGKHVPKNDPHGLPWIHRTCAKKMIDKENVGHIERDYDRIIHEYGAQELSKTSAGQDILKRAGHKYRTELVQPGDPEFNKLYGKQNKEREERRRANVEISQRMKRDCGMV